MWLLKTGDPLIEVTTSRFGCSLGETLTLRYQELNILYQPVLGGAKFLYFLKI